MQIYFFNLILYFGEFNLLGIQVWV